MAIITPKEIEIGASNFDSSFKMIMWCGVPNIKIWPQDQWNIPHYVIPYVACFPGCRTNS